MEANLVLQDLQKEEDWSWLRERKVLGPCRGGLYPPEFKLDPSVYKPCTKYGDSLRLHRVFPNGEIIERDYIEVPYASDGMLNHIRQKEYDPILLTNTRDTHLRAIVVGDTITFSRPLRPWESDRVAVIDVQRRMKPLHICNENCTTIDGETPDYDNNKPCKEIEHKIFTEIPDPNYMVIRTAQMHAEGSPSAQGRIASLSDQSNKILSSMRQNDAMLTYPDTIEYTYPHYWNII